MTTLARLAVLCVAVGLCTGTLVPLDDFNTLSLDKFARRKLAFIVLVKLNQSLENQDLIQHQCEVKINSSLDQCKACVYRSHLKPNVGQHTASSADLLGADLITILQPVVLAAEVVNDIEGSLEKVVNVLGDKTIDFVKDVGSIAKNAGDSLIDGVSDITNDALHGLTHFGDELAGLAGDLEHGLETAVHGLESGTIDLGISIANGLGTIGEQLEHGVQGALNGVNFIEEQLEHGVQGALDGVNHLGHEIEHVGSSLGHTITEVGHDIGHVFGGLFGKRSACPICDTLSTKARTTNEIVNDVCGADETFRAATALITKLKAFSNTMFSKPIITKVEYDPATIDVTSGIAFKTVYVTYTINRTSTRYQSHVPLRLTALPVTGEALGLEIFGLAS